jgi:hypothetical protein
MYIANNKLKTHLYTNELQKQSQQWHSKQRAIIGGDVEGQML